MNDPNGLVFFDGYYHAFYPYQPSYEQPWLAPMLWGHARTKDFLHREELPVAPDADRPYDKDGVWSGTATVKDGVLYVFFASVSDKKQTISVARSFDGIRFEKYEKNPVIRDYPKVRKRQKEYDLSNEKGLQQNAQDYAKHKKDRI